MMIEKLVVVSQIEVTEAKIVQVRMTTRLIEDGKCLSETYHRHCITPGQEYNQEAADVQAICSVVHTPDVVAAYMGKLL